MTLTEVIESWARDAERMNGSPARGVVVTAELFAQLAKEQGTEAPSVAGVAVEPIGTHGPEMVEIPGPDRVSIYVGQSPGESAFPRGLDPAMPVVFVPAPPAGFVSQAALEMYNRLRWYGLGPDEARAGSQQ